MNLEEAIGQLIELGEKDPLNIARRVESNYGHDWLVEQLSLYSEQLVAELARQRLGSVRRRAEAAIQPGDPVSSGEMKLKAIWIAGYGYKRVADVTAEDLELRASMYRRLAGVMLVRADWCLDVVALMRAEGVLTLGELRADLPVLPPAQFADHMIELVSA